MIASCDSTFSGGWEISMRRALFGALALILGVGLFAGAALAAPAASGWSGAFAGVEAGGGWSNRSGCWAFGAPVPACTNPSRAFNYNQSGWLGGIQVGYNWQLPSNLLVGLQGAFDIANIAGTIPSGSSAGSGGWNALGLLTGKLGWTSGQWMFYGDAGVAAGSFSYAANSGCNFTMGHTGPAAGAGVGWKVSQALSLNVEYDHAWFDTVTTPCTGNHTNIDVKTGGGLDVVKVGLSYALGQ
jgi:opacity protein-like surface antigen